MGLWDCLLLLALPGAPLDCGTTLRQPLRGVRIGVRDVLAVVMSSDDQQPLAPCVQARHPKDARTKSQVAILD